MTNLKSKNKLDWGSSGNDAVTGMVDKQEVQDSQKSHESCRIYRTTLLWVGCSSYMKKLHRNAEDK